MPSRARSFGRLFRVCFSVDSFGELLQRLALQHFDLLRLGQRVRVDVSFDAIGDHLAQRGRRDGIKLHRLALETRGSAVGLLRRARWQIELGDLFLRYGHAFEGEAITAEYGVETIE